MPPIIEDYADIKRRMDELSGVRPKAVDSVTINIEARPADAGVGEAIAKSIWAFARGGIVKPVPYIVGERPSEYFLPSSMGAK